MTRKPKTYDEFREWLNCRLARKGLQSRVAQPIYDLFGMLILRIEMRKHDGSRLLVPAFFNGSDYERSARQLIRQCRKIEKGLVENNSSRKR